MCGGGDIGGGERWTKSMVEWMDERKEKWREGELLMKGGRDE